MATVDLTPRGPAGSSGLGILSAWPPRKPTLADGREKEFWLHQGRGILYQRLNGVWKEIVRVKGTPGERGAIGKSILSGHGAPEPTYGHLDDFYLDLDASLLYGPKVNYFAWPVGPIALQGPTGATGPLPWQRVPSTWTTGLVATAAAPATTVVVAGSLYGCAISHTAGASFATDLGAGKWVLLASKGDTGSTGSTGVTGATGPLPLLPIAAWLTGTAYVIGPPASYVAQGGASYQCLITHTAGSFATDLAAGKWGLVAQKGDVGAKGDTGNTGPAGPAPLAAIAPWVTGMSCLVGPPATFVSQGGSSYQCLIAHTAGTFTTDLAAGKWGLVAQKGADGIGTGNVNPSGTIASGHVAVFGDNTGNVIADGGAPSQFATTAALAAKADASAMTTALAAKADSSAMTTALAAKADTSALAAKADVSAVPSRGTIIGLSYGDGLGY